MLDPEWTLRNRSNSLLHHKGGIILEIKVNKCLLNFQIDFFKLINNEDAETEPMETYVQFMPK